MAKGSSDHGGDGPGGEDPIRAAERELEGHETAVYDELLKRILGDLPPDAGPAQVIEIVRRSILEDPENRDLLMRITLMAHHGGRGTRERLQGPLDSPNAKWAHALYDDILRREEIEVIGRLGELIDERLPPEAPPSERRALAERLSVENQEFALLAARLDFLSESRGERSFARALTKLSKEEELEE